MPKPLVNYKKADGERPTDQWTARSTDIEGYRVACTRIKIERETDRHRDRKKTVYNEDRQ